MRPMCSRGKIAVGINSRSWVAMLLIAGYVCTTGYMYAHAEEQDTSSSKPSADQIAKRDIKGGSLLNLDDVINATLHHHPALKAEMQERVAADGTLLSAEGAFDPNIKSDIFSTATGGYSGNYGSAYVEQPLQLYGSKVVAGYRVGRGLFPTYEDYYATNSGGELGAGVEVPLLRDGPIDRRRAAIGQSISGQTIADSAIEQRRIELARAAALTYWDWTAARNKALVYKRLLQVADERDRQISERVKRGDLPDFDRIDNQRAVLQRKAQLLSAERAVRNAEFNLALFFRDDMGQPRAVETFEALSRIPLPLFVPDASVEAPIAEAVKARPEFKNISAQREQNELELKLARNQMLPRLDLRVFSANDVGSGEVRREEPEIKAGVRIEIPLLTRTQEGRIALFEARQQKLAFTETFLKERIRADVQDALNALDIARLRVDVVKREVEASEDLAQGELKRFELGDSNLIFVNLREQNAADAQVREIEALQDYQKAFVAFEATLARIASPTT